MSEDSNTGEILKVLEKGNNLDNTVFYRKSSDGYVEQWGTFQGTGEDTQVTFLMEYTYTDYVVILTGINSQPMDPSLLVKQKATTGFRVDHNTSFMWKATGYVYSEE